MRFFNTEGPTRLERHYTIPPLTRWDLAEINELIDAEKYFLLHAPRQTGKTTCLLALMDYLNREGRYRAVYANIEGAEVVRGDVARGIATICSVLSRSARLYLRDLRLGEWDQTCGIQVPPEDRLTQILEFWAASDPRPTVLLLDEFDALTDDTLISVLRQLRAGHPQRPHAFPQSIIFCGVRDLRARRMTDGVEFDVLSKAVRLGDFTENDIETLLIEHTADTGQVFMPDAMKRVWELTQGQPWWVNALAYHACFESPYGKDRNNSITVAQIDAAKEYLIANRMTKMRGRSRPSGQGGCQS